MICRHKSGDLFHPPRLQHKASIQYQFSRYTYHILLFERYKWQESDVIACRFVFQYILLISLLVFTIMLMNRVSIPSLKYSHK